MANNHLFLIMFSGGNDQEIEFQVIEIGIFQEVKTFCKIVQEIEKALGALECY
jgi:hypothetical protein